MKEKNIDYSEIFSKMLHCLYVIIAILVLNSILLTISLGSTGSKDNNTGSDEQEKLPYDVSQFKEMTTNQAMEAIQSSELQVIYIGRSGCGYCRAYVPLLTQAQKAYGFTTIYIDTDKLTNADSEKWMALDEYVEQSFGRTPLTILAANGQFVDGQLGYMDYDTLKAFLEKNGLQAK